MKEDRILYLFSGSCRSTFALPDKAPILPGNEAVPECTKEFSDISPITGGNIAFSTLENRPSASDFEESPVLRVCVFSITISMTSYLPYTSHQDVFIIQLNREVSFRQLTTCKVLSHFHLIFQNCIKLTSIWQ